MFLCGLVLQLSQYRCVSIFHSSMRAVIFFFSFFHSFGTLIMKFSGFNMLTWSSFLSLICLLCCVVLVVIVMQ